MKYISFKQFLAYGTKKTAPWFTKIYWPISQPLSYILYLAGFSPNAISFLGILLGIVGGLLLVAGYPISGVLVMLFSYILDFCDGNVARVWYTFLNIPREGRQKRGLLFENMYANVVYAFLFLGMGYYVVTLTGNPAYFYYGASIFVLKLITRYTVLHMTLLNRGEAAAAGADMQKSELFQESLLNRVKYAMTSIIDGARVYFLAYLIVLIFWPQILPTFFVAYVTYTGVMNLLKIILTVVRQQP